MADDIRNFAEEYEIEKLKAELLQEEQMKEMLNKSSAEMKQTVEQLEKRIGSIDVESNEWKTRFEIQEEINQQVEKQTLMLQQKIDITKKSLIKLRQSQLYGDQDDIIEPTPAMIKILQKQKLSLETQIRDLEWRLEQESKAYHKANDERKQYIVDINMANYSLDNMLKRKDNSTSPSLSLRNIPEDQRVIDPKKGPIKRTAAVKHLPKLPPDEPIY